MRTIGILLTLCVSPPIGADVATRVERGAGGSPTESVAMSPKPEANVNGSGGGQTAPGKHAKLTTTGPFG